MAKKIEDNKENFEKTFHKIVSENNVNKMEKFLLTSDFMSYSQKYKQSVLNHLVCSGYKQEKLAKWALTNTTLGMKGDIHENADRPLRLAAKLNVDFAKYLLTSPELEKKANINTTNDGSSALLEAIQSNNLEFVQYLLTNSELEKKARLNVGKKEFDDALCKACEKNHTEIVKYLLSPECYPKPKKFNAKENLTRFNFAPVKKMIYNDNVELLKFLKEKELFDIKPNLHDWFCLAIISDSKNVATYLEDFFDEKPILSQIQFEGESLFFSVARANHYGRMQNHSYLHAMLEEVSYTITPQELEKIKHFYVYDKSNDKAQRLTKILEIYLERNKISANLKTKNSKKELHKI